MHKLRKFRKSHHVPNANANANAVDGGRGPYGPNAHEHGPPPGHSLRHLPSLDNVLPPTSDYRQSLILPHLSRRFTLLRHPNGELVSTDDMRRHLRNQRDRARANGVPDDGPRNYLTEEEEDAVIEEMRAQALYERTHLPDHLTPSPSAAQYAAYTGQPSPGSAFTYSPPPSVNPLTHSPRSGGTSNLFSSRESARDADYLRRVAKTDARKRSDSTHSNNNDSASARGTAQESPRAGRSPAALTTPLSSLSPSANGDRLSATTTATGESLERVASVSSSTGSRSSSRPTPHFSRPTRPVRIQSDDSAGIRSEYLGSVGERDSMATEAFGHDGDANADPPVSASSGLLSPAVIEGDERHASLSPSPSQASDSPDPSYPQPSHFRHRPGSAVLDNLSPEAQQRVSMALDEVFEKLGMSGRLSPADAGASSIGAAGLRRSLSRSTSKNGLDLLKAAGLGDVGEAEEEEEEEMEEELEAEEEAMSNGDALGLERQPSFAAEGLQLEGEKQPAADGRQRKVVGRTMSRSDSVAATEDGGTDSVYGTPRSSPVQKQAVLGPPSNQNGPSAAKHRDEGEGEGEEEAEVGVEMIDSAASSPVHELMSFAPDAQAQAQAQAQAAAANHESLRYETSQQHSNVTKARPDAAFAANMNLARLEDDHSTLDSHDPGSPISTVGSLGSLGGGVHQFSFPSVPPMPHRAEPPANPKPPSSVPSVIPAEPVSASTQETGISGAFPRRRSSSASSSALLSVVSGGSGGGGGGGGDGARRVGGGASKGIPPITTQGLPLTQSPLASGQSQSPLSPGVAVSSPGGGTGFKQPVAQVDHANDRMKLAHSPSAGSVLQAAGLSHHGGSRRPSASSGSGAVPVAEQHAGSLSRMNSVASLSSGHRLGLSRSRSSSAASVSQKGGAHSRTSSLASASGVPAPVPVPVPVSARTLVPGGGRPEQNRTRRSSRESSIISAASISARSQHRYFPHSRSPSRDSHAYGFRPSSRDSSTVAIDRRPESSTSTAASHPQLRRGESMEYLAATPSSPPSAPTGFDVLADFVDPGAQPRNTSSTTTQSVTASRASSQGIFSVGGADLSARSGDGSPGTSLHDSSPARQSGASAEHGYTFKDHGQAFTTTTTTTTTEASPPPPWLFPIGRANADAESVKSVSVTGDSDDGQGGYDSGEDVWERVSRSHAVASVEAGGGGGGGGGGHQSVGDGSIVGSALSHHQGDHLEIVGKPDPHRVSVVPPEIAANSLEQAGITITDLAAIQQKLVRSASQRRAFAGPTLSNSPSNVSLRSADSSSVHGQTVGNRLERAREKARALADRASEARPQQQQQQQQQQENAVDTSAAELEQEKLADDFASPFQTPADTSTVPAPNERQSNGGQVDGWNDMTRRTSPNAPSVTLPPFVPASRKNSLRERAASPAPLGLATAGRRPLSPPPVVPGSRADFGERARSPSPSLLPSSGMLAPGGTSGAFSRSSPNVASFHSPSPLPPDFFAPPPPASNNSRSASPSPFDQHRERHHPAPLTYLPPPGIDLSPSLEAHQGVSPGVSPGLSPGRSTFATSDEAGTQTPSDSPALFRDIEAQAAAATAALKAPGGVPLDPPRRPRRKSILRRTKSQKALTKDISTPQLISSSAKLDHIPDIIQHPAAVVARHPNRPIRRGEPATAMPYVSGVGPDHRMLSPSKSTPHLHQYPRIPRSAPVALMDGPGIPMHRAPSPVRPDSFAKDLPPVSATATLGRFVSKLRRRKDLDTPGPGAVDPFPTSAPPAHSRDSDAMMRQGFANVAAVAGESIQFPPRSTSVMALTPGGARLPSDVTPGPFPTLTPRVDGARASSISSSLGQAASGLWRNASTRKSRMPADLVSSAEVAQRWEEEAAEAEPAEAEPAIVLPSPRRASKANNADPAARNTVVRRTIILAQGHPNLPPNLPSSPTSPYPPPHGSPTSERRRSKSTADRTPTTPKASVAGTGSPDSRRGSVASRRSVQDRPPTPPGHRRHPSKEVPPDEPVPPVPARLSIASSHFKPSRPKHLSVATAHRKPPSSPSTPGFPSSGTRASVAPSMYGASLYDMYLGDDDDEELPPPLPRTSFDSRGSFDARRLSGVSAGGRGLTASWSLEGSKAAQQQQQQHIEITEHADGSVVWQVVAGLSGGNGYEDDDSFSFVGRHSRKGSQGSNFSVADSARSRRLSGQPHHGHHRSSVASSPRQPAFFPSSSSSSSSAAAGHRLSANGNDRQQPALAQADEVIYTTDQRLAELIEDLSRGVDHAHFNLLPRHRAGADGENGANRVSVRSEASSTEWEVQRNVAVERQIDRLLDGVARGGHVSTPSRDF